MMKLEREDKFQIQDTQYQFPYHYLAHLEESGHVRTSRRLRWGREYLCYLLFLVERIRGSSPRSMLDVGCGDGRLLGLVGDEVTRRVGIDLSGRAIAFARAFHPHLDFRVADAAALSESFEVVTAIEVLEHIPDDAIGGFLRAVTDRAVLGGKVVISVPTSNLPVNEKHYRHYDRALLLEQVCASGAALELERVDYVYRQPRWLKVLQRAMDNRLFRVEIASVERLLWRHTWENLRQAGPRDAHHLVATFRRG
jgi:2-polyprenyl-3-methyl-5-hydroxy-6-metoxy-1,4-benzoquinol methylase